MTNSASILASWANPANGTLADDALIEILGFDGGVDVKIRHFIFYSPDQRCLSM
jgi:hypothetical protein